MTASRHQGAVLVDIGVRTPRTSVGKEGYFAAPAVRPATIRRWNSSTTTTSGTVTRTPAAIWLPNGVSNWVAPANLEIATGAVWMEGLLVIESAMRNSFQAAMKVMI